MKRTASVLFAALFVTACGGSALAPGEGEAESPDAPESSDRHDVPGMALAAGASTAAADPSGPGKREVQPPVDAEKAPPATPRKEGLPPLDQLTRQIPSYFEANVGRRIYVQVDKPLYKPGETIWLKTWDLRARDLGDARGARVVRYQLISPKGAVVLDKRVQQQAGAASNDFEIPDSVVGGQYIVRAIADDGLQGERPIIVSTYEPPRIKKKLEFVRKAYGEGDEVSATIEIKRPTGEPLPNHPLRAQINLDGQMLPPVRLTTNADGGGVVRFRLPDQIARGDGLLTVLIDDGGITESISRRVPIILERLQLSFFPEGGQMVTGLPSRLYFDARDLLGKPADAQGRIVDDHGNAVAEFATYKNGLGRVGFTPSTGRRYHAEVTKPVGVTEHYPLPLAQSDGCVVRSFDDFDGQLTALRIAVRCSQPQTVHVVGMLRENLLDAATVEISGRDEAIVYLEPKGDRVNLAHAQGTARITVFDASLRPVAERLVFRNRRKGLRVEIEPDSETYGPREQVALTIRTKDHEGHAVPAELALSVVDDTVISFADDKKGHMLSRLLLESELPDEVEEPNFYLDLTEKQSAFALDLLMGTGGWRRFDWQPVLAIRAPLQIATGTESTSTPAPQPEPVVDAVLEKGEADEEDFAEEEPAEERALAVRRAPRKADVHKAGKKRREPRPAANKPRARPAAPKPKPAMDKPAMDKPAMDKPAMDKPAMDKPAMDKPAMDKPAMNKAARRRGPARRARAEAPMELAPADEPPAGEIAMAEAMGDLDDDLAGAGAAMHLGGQVMAKDMEWDGFEQQKKKRAGPPPVAAVRVFPAPDYSTPHEGVRTDFRETIHWAPTVRTGQRGKVTVTFYLSDAVTSFRAFAEGAGQGRIGRAEKVFQSKLPFSMSVKLPVEVSAGDHILLPVTLSNERGEDLPVSLNASFGDLLKLSKPVALPSPTLGAHARQSLYYPIDVTGTQGRSAVSFAANAGGLTDEFTREVTVVPAGFPVFETRSGTVADTTRLQVDLGDAVAGSVTAKLELFASPVATMVSGLAGMLREPHGCFEQTSSTNYPNVMVLRYLEANDVADPALVQRARGLMKKGYQRLIGFETKDRGYEWFGHSPGHEALSAYGLVQFRDMGGVMSGIDEEMMRRTARWLKSRRDGKGGYQRSGQALDSFGRAAPEVTDAYITYSLVAAGLGNDLGPEIDTQVRLAAQTRDPYLLGLATLTLLDIDTRRAAGISGARRLAELQAKDGSWTGADHSITRSAGQNLTIETTAVALLALMKAAGHDAAVRRGVEWLNGSRGSYGRWGATQATVLSLNALTTYANLSRRTQSPGSVQVLINGRVVAEQAYAAGRREPIEFAALGGQFQSGTNAVEIRHQGAAGLPFNLTVEARTLEPADHPETVVSLEISIARTKLVMGESARVTAVVTNRTDKGQPMTLARVGLPGGLAYQTWQLEELRKKGLIAFYETRPREVIVYFRQMKPNERREIPLDLVATVPGRYTGPASSAYLYYTDDEKVWQPGLAVEIEPGG